MPPKKHASTRARANKASTAATLTVRGSIDYSDWSAAELRDEIAQRNKGRENKLPNADLKTHLAGMLAADDIVGPKLPEREHGWHANTGLMWASIWASPMSDEWDASDLHNVFVLAAIYDDIWRAETAKERKEAASEYRLQRVDLGLSPYSRRRLEWTIEGADEARDKGNRRRSTGRADAPAKDSRPDPRAGLHSVS